MKKFILLAGLTALTALLTVSGLALAAGDMPYHQGEIVQNVKGISTKKAQSRCDDVSGTKPVLKNYSIAGYRYAEGEVVDAVGAARPVKWYLDGKHIKTGSSIELTNPDRSDTTQFQTLGYKDYSTVTANRTGCRRGQ